MIIRNNKPRTERIQERIDTGFVSRHFPGVISIVIDMIYKQQGVNQIHRIMNFAPDSYAFFKVTCLSSDCVDGGFDLTHIINSAIRRHDTGVKGEITCDDSGPRADHSAISYEVAIQYT